MRNHNPEERCLALPLSRKRAIEAVCAGHVIGKVRCPSALLGWLQELWPVRGHARSYVPMNHFYNVRRAGDNA